MEDTLRNVAIIGASGNIGKLILDGFIDNPSFKVTVLTRASSSATFPPGFTIRKTDYSHTDLVSALTGQDAVISVMGMEGFSSQKSFIDAAVAAGVKRFIPSEFSFNSWSPAVQELLPPVVDQKVEVLRYLKSVESKGSGLTWSAIWTALLFDWCLGNGYLEYNLTAKTATIWDQGNKKFTLTNVDQMQRAVIATLENPRQTQNKNLYVASLETTQNDILAALEQATASKWEVKHTTTEKELRAGREALKNGDLVGVSKLVRATSFADIPNLHENYTTEEGYANELLGLKLESVHDTITRVLGL